MEQEQNARAMIKVAGLLTDRLKEIWRNFMEEFQQSFDLNQLDLVFSVLKELDSSSQNPVRKKRIHFMQREYESQENNNNHQSSLEKKVFGNHLLAKSVFQFLSNSDLLSCRLMNSHWNEYATEMLLKSDFKIEFGTRVNRFFLRRSNWRTLDMFTQLLRTSKQFPCSSFVFWGGNLGNDDAQRFFSCYGPAIKGIKISVNDKIEEDMDKSEDGFSVGVTDSRVIGMILSQQLPYLENLELDLFYLCTRNWRGFKSLLFSPDKKTVLAHLKTVVYDGCPGDQDFLRQFLNAAVNLKRFEFEDDSFNMDYLDTFIETGKIKSIPCLGFCANTELNELEKMGEYGPEVKWLTLLDFSSVYKSPEFWGKISTVLSKFLHSSQKSLDEINSFDSLGFLRQLKLPVLENVKELDFKVMNQSAFNPQDIHDYSFAFLPRGATFSQNFPKVISLSFEFESEISSEDAAEWWKKCFRTDEIVPTVKKLSIWGPALCPLLWIEKFSEMFPRLKILSVKNVMDFPNCSKILWNSYTKLKNLTLEIILSSPLNSYPALDSSFAGISPETCKTLEKQSLFSLERIGDNFKDNPSLLNLTDLQTLDITFQVNYQENQQLDFNNFLTKISGPCAFHLLENLKSVNIGISGVQDKNVLSRIKKSLEPLKAYKVNIK